MKIKDVRKLRDLFKTKEFNTLPYFKKLWFRILILTAALFSKK